MKTSFCFFLTYWFLLSTHVQSQPIFEKIYDFTNMDRFYDMILTSDSSLLLYGTGENGIILIKTDLMGEVIWQNIYNWETKNSWVKQIMESSTGFYYLTGSFTHKPLLMKINSEGDSLWSKIWEASPDIPVNISTIKQMSNNKLFLSFELDYSQYSAPPESFVRITDTLGNEICSDGGEDGTIHQTFIVNDYVYIIWTDWYNWYNKNIEITKYLNCSNVNYYSFELDGNANDLLIDNLGNIYFASSSYNKDITKTNGDGVILWSVNLFPDLQSSANSFILQEGKVISTGVFSDTTNQNRFFIAICDTAGSINNVYTNQDYSVQIGKKIIQIGDYLYIAGDLRIEEPPVWNWDIFLQKYPLDSLTTSSRSTSTYDEKHIQIYPNPTKGRFEVRCSKFSLLEDKIMYIYNSKGVKIEKIKIPAGKEIVIVDGETWPKGMYIAAVYLKGSITGQTKIIIH